MRNRNHFHILLPQDFLPQLQLFSTITIMSNGHSTPPSNRPFLCHVTFTPGRAMQKKAEMIRLLLANE